jgi:heat-inducible transcriptional repressor
MKSATFKSLPTRKLPKTDREQAVLLGLIELYLKTGKPVGSQTLQEFGFESLSTATIRNYFGKMEEAGYLKQQHTSGGRIPTAKAFRLYVDQCKNSPVLEDSQQKFLSELFSSDNRAIASAIHAAAEALSQESKCAVFVSTPRFDQDFIQDVRLVSLEPTKILSVLITDFGLIHTETIHLDEPASIPFLRSTEEYFRWRMKNGEKPLFSSDQEAKTAQRIYNEVMVRHVVGYANFPVEDILRTGLSKLLAYPEFNDAAALAKSLSLLEDDAQMRTLLRACSQKNELTAWIGDELCPYVPPSSECAVIAIPYYVNQTPIGAIALLGPMRLPYRNVFGLLQAFSETVSRKLTERLYKYKISYRQPEKSGDKQLQHGSIRLENQSKDL